MPVIQNVSIPAGDDIELTFNLDDDALVLLVGGEIIWNVYAQAFGVPEADPVITKTVASGITVPGSPADIFYVAVAGSDTKAMLHNYYHEAYVKDVNNNKFTVTAGILTVTLTKIASAQ